MKHARSQRKIQFATLALLLSAPTVAWAQTATETPDAMFERGRSLRAQHRDQEALEVFRALHQRTGEARALAQVGLAEGALALWVEAERDLARALSFRDDVWVNRNRATLESALATLRTHVGDLEVLCDATGAELWINNARVGTLPLNTPARVPAGTVVIEVRAPGRRTLTREITVAAATLSRERVVLLPAEVSQGNPGSSTTPASGNGNSGSGNSGSGNSGSGNSGSGNSGSSDPPGNLGTPPGPNDNPPPSSLRRTLGIVGVGVGGALMLGGGISYLVGLGPVASYNNDPQCPGTGAMSQPAACQSLLNSAYTMQTLAITGLAVGAGLAVAGLIVWLTAPSTSTRSNSARLQCAPGFLGAGCQLDF